MWTVDRMLSGATSAPPHPRLTAACSAAAIKRIWRNCAAELTWLGAVSPPWPIVFRDVNGNSWNCSLEEIIRTLGVNGKYIDVKLDTYLQRSYRRLTKLHDGPSPGIVKFREVPLRALLVSTDSPPCPTFRTVHWCRLQLPLWLHPS